MASTNIRRRTRTLARTTTILAAGALTLGATQAQQPAAFGPSNPLYAPSTLPYQAPPFDKIHDADYQPAIEAGIAQQRDEVELIANNPAAPTFDNTIVALERSGQLLTRATLVFGAVTGANTNDTLQKVQDAVAPKLAAAQDAIFLNSKLFARVKTVYDKRASLNLDPESLRLVEYDYQQFTKAGANLSEANKTKLKKLNEEDAKLSNDFLNKLLAAAKAGAYVTTDKSALAGLTDAQISAAELSAKDTKQPGYRVPLQNTTQQPDLAELTNRATRQTIFNNSITRTEHGDANDTRATISRLAQIRAEKAHLLGFPNYAAWTLQDQMAKTPEAALKFMDDLVPASTAKAQGEAAEIQALIDQQKGGFQLKPWDWNFYSEQVRKAKYDLDENEVKPYFEINRVLQDGVFYAANQLYGLTFKERKDLPVYDPDVRVFEVFDTNGKTLALAYFDYFKRDNKQGGAWMSNLVNQSTLLGTIPVIYNVANFQKPAPGQPAHQLRRRHNHVPRVRPRPAWHVRRHQIPQPLRHLCPPRLRRVPLAVQRTLGQQPAGLRSFRKALSNRRSHARRTRREDQKSLHLQRRLLAHRAPRRRRTGHAMALHPLHRPAAKRRRLRKSRPRPHPSQPGNRPTPLPLQLLPPHLG